MGQVVVVPPSRARISTSRTIAGTTSACRRGHDGATPMAVRPHLAPAKWGLPGVPQPAEKPTLCHPVAPSGTTSARTGVCV
jgi:hypothetical protein